MRDCNFKTSTPLPKKLPRASFHLIVLLRDYFNSLNFYKNGELSRNQIGRSGVQVKKKKNEKFTLVRSRSPQNLKCGHFTLLFCRGRHRNVPKCKTHVQRLFLLIKPIVLRRCHCRRRRPCLSSLFNYRKAFVPLDCSILANKTVLLSIPLFV